MHDPMTLAFSIKYPWKNKHGYRDSIVDIWHADPERSCNHGNRSDDSCGWHTPPTTPVERESIKGLGEKEFYSLFGKRRALRDNESYAYVCYEPTTYDAIYWAWRHIKYHQSRHVWMFGPQRGAFSASELEQIYMLASSPIDNLAMSVAEVQSEKTCGEFYLTVYRCMLRFYRPWYCHPRWHFWHWKVTVIPARTLGRLLFGPRCRTCGGRFWPSHIICDHGGWNGSRDNWHHGHCVGGSSAKAAK